MVCGGEGCEWCVVGRYVSGVWWGVWGEGCEWEGDAVCV